MWSLSCFNTGNTFINVHTIHVSQVFIPQNLCAITELLSSTASLKTFCHHHVCVCFWFFFHHEIKDQTKLLPSLKQPINMYYVPGIKCYAKC